MSTVNDLCAAALREIGVLAGGEAAPYNDAADAFSTLNRMVDQWRAERLNIPNMVRTEYALQANVGEYFLGSDANLPLTDGFDNAWTGAPDNWTANTTGDGTITNDTTVYQAGGHAVNTEVTISGTASIYRDFTVRSGEELVVSVYSRATFTSAGFIQIQNRNTLNYLTNAGVWQPAQADCDEVNVSGSFVEETITFDVEGAATVGSSTTTIRITFRQADVTAEVWFDTFSLTGSIIVPIVRPVYIDHVNLLDTSTDPDFEIPLSPLTDDGWANVREKALTDSYPSHWYYNPTYPNGTLSVWPIPTGSGLKLVLYVPTSVSTFAALSTQVVLPPGYERMIVKNLAVELAPSYGRQPSPLLLMQANDSRATVKRSNYRMREMSSEAALMFGQRPTFDIRTGR